MFDRSLRGLVIITVFISFSLMANNQTVSISGHVIDANHDGVADATVGLIGLQLQTTTDMYGAYTLNNLPSNLAPNMSTVQKGNAITIRQNELIVTLEQSSQVTVKLFNINGRLVTPAINEKMNTGTNRFVLTKSLLPTGVYLAHVKIGNSETNFKTTLTNGYCKLSSTILSKTSSLAKNTAAAVDTLIVSKSGFSTMLIPIESWTGTVNVIMGQDAQQKVATITIQAKSQNGNALTKRMATASTENIESFKVLITQVCLYKDVQLNGSGWSSASGPLSLFNCDSALSAGYDHFNADSARKSDTGYINFLDTNSVKKLSSPKSLSAMDTGAYKYVIVNFNKPFKIRASVPSVTGTTFYTHDGPVSDSFFPNTTIPNYKTHSATLLTTSPAEEAVVTMNNGGTLFRLLNPMRVTQTDIDSNRQFNLLMFFNTNGFLYGFNNRLASGDPSGIYDTAGNQIMVPFLDLTPVAYRKGDTVLLETYKFDINDTSVSGDHRAYDLKLDICTLREDSTNIYATSLRGLVNEHQQVPTAPPKIFFISKDGEKYSFKNWDNSPIIDNFTRLGTVNDSSHANFYKANISSVATFNVSYKLVEKKQIN